jgi:hypothetical protein
LCSIGSRFIGVSPIYAEANSDSEIIAQLTPAPFIVIIAQSENGWYEVRLDAELMLVPEDTQRTSGWINPESAIDLYGDCSAFR